jgi:hypothetical protein
MRERANDGSGCSPGVRELAQRQCLKPTHARPRLVAGADAGRGGRRGGEALGQPV